MGDNKKNSYKAEVKVDEVKVPELKAEKLDKFDFNFNKASVDFKGVETKSEVKKDVETKKNIEVKVEPSVAETKVEVKPEPVVFKKNTTQKGVVVTVSDFSYTVKTNDGKGVHVVGKHNKKIGDTVMV